MPTTVTFSTCETRGEGWKGRRANLDLPSDWGVPFRPRDWFFKNGNNIFENDSHNFVPVQKSTPK